MSRPLPDEMRGSFGRIVRLLRQTRHLTQKELARRADINRSYLAELEAGWHRNPSIDTVERLAAALETHVEALLGK